MDNNSQTMADGDGVSVHSGFPNPAVDRQGQGARLALDLNQLLIKHPSSTYLFRVAGHHWSDQGVYDGDIAVVDRALEPRPADLVVAWRLDGSTLCLYRDLIASAQFWGVVTATIHDRANRLQ
ncbi:MAG TPA: S24 family peptidase [Candidatus Dormibacteraeota bacterium]|nr:S24 family peptidase [Candidatus Dormibacteraeota bacterium]